MIYTLSKLGCMAIYVLALTSLAGWPGGSMASLVQIMAVLLLATHLLEALLLHKQLRKFPGSFTSNVGKTVLFGLLHWKPLLAAQARKPEVP